MSRVASRVQVALGRKPAGGAEDITVKTYASALNSRLGNIVDSLDNVPAFLVVDPSGKPLKVNVGEKEGTNLTFTYLEFSDAEGLANGLRTPSGEPVPGIEVIGTTLGQVVRDYLATREQNATDEMLIMPGSQEARTAQELMTKLGSQNPMVPNAVPIYQVEGLPAEGKEAKNGEGKAPGLSFFRFTDMQARIERFRKATAKAEGLADASEAKPKLRVRMMRLHEVAALAGTERLPDKPQFVPSTVAIADAERLSEASKKSAAKSDAATSSTKAEDDKSTDASSAS